MFTQSNSSKSKFIVTSILSFIIILVASIGAPTAHADTTFTVNSTLDEPDAHPGDGRCQSTPSEKCTLRAAIMEGNVLPGDETIIIPKGTYVLTQTGAREDHALRGDLDIRHNMIIQGAGITATVIDGDRADRVFDIFDAKVEISNLTIRHGWLKNSTTGGGIRNRGNLNVRNVIIQNNRAGAGGGIENESAGALWLQDVTLLSNHATAPADSRAVSSQGGGLMNWGSASLTRVLVSQNTAYCFGAGISTESIAITDSEIEGNAITESCNIGSYGNGGGIYIGPESNVTINNTTIANNSARFAGGLMDWESGPDSHPNLLMTNVTVSGNRATVGHGGGMEIRGSATLNNVTVANNVGLGVSFEAYWDGTNFSVANSIFANNYGGDCAGTPTSLGYNIESGTTCGFSATGDRSSTDPLLLPLDNYGGFAKTHALQSTSPAIDNGNPSGCTDGTGAPLTTDERGITRPVDGDGNGSAICDIGAVEYQPTTR